MCSALQAEVEHLRSLVLQCLDDQKKLQQETLRLSSQLQRFCSGTEGIQQVRTRHLSSQPCSGLSTLILVLCRLQRRKQLLTDPSIRVEVRCLILGSAADSGSASNNGNEAKKPVSIGDSPVLEGPGIPLYFSWLEISSQILWRVPDGCGE